MAIFKLKSVLPNLKEPLEVHLSSNIIYKSLMNFVAIEPSKTNDINNNETLLLKEISTLIEEKNYKTSYKKIITLNNFETYFKETINQIQIANDFKTLINKTI